MHTSTHTVEHAPHEPQRVSSGSQNRLLHAFQVDGVVGQHDRLVVVSARAVLQISQDRKRDGARFPRTVGSLEHQVSTPGVPDDVLHVLRGSLEFRVHLHRLGQAVLDFQSFQVLEPHHFVWVGGILAYRPFARLRALMRISSSVRSGGGAAAVVAVLA